MWGFLEVRVGGVSEVIGRGLRRDRKRRLGGLRRSKLRGFWVRLVSSGIFRSMKKGLGGVAHPREGGARSWRGRRRGLGTQPSEEEDEVEEHGAEGFHSSEDAYRCGGAGRKGLTREVALESMPTPGGHAHPLGPCPLVPRWTTSRAQLRTWKSWRTYCKSLKAGALAAVAKRH